MQLRDDLWNKWKSDWNWMISIAENKNWDYNDIVIKEIVAEEQIVNLEKEIKNKLPNDFRQVLKERSSGVFFNWHMDSDEIEGFEAIFCGGSDGILWDFDQLGNMYKNYQGWIKTCFPNPEDNYDKIWHDKIPFLYIGNGDMIAFEIVEGKDEYPIIFLSHDGSDFHGNRLADSFTEFITNWSNIGCVGTDDWVLEIFYDFENQKLMSNSPIIDEWKQALVKQ